MKKFKIIFALLAVFLLVFTTTISVSAAESEIENELQEENLKNLLNKINLILRIKKIEESSLSVEKILFMTWVEKMVAMESNNVR